jgi:hypothetical protein
METPRMDFIMESSTSGAKRDRAKHGDEACLGVSVDGSFFFSFLFSSLGFPGPRRWGWVGMACLGSVWVASGRERR